MPKTIVITSGFFNPIHPGHVDCFELAKRLGDELIVIVNNDHQAELKRGVPSFQDQDYRMRIVSVMKPVDRVVLSIDQDGTVCETLKMLLSELKQDLDVTEIIFAKGGDRFGYEIPEGPVCKEFGVRLVDGLGPKTHSSSEIIKHV